MIAVGLSCMAFIMLRPTFWRIFIINCWILSKSFFCIYWDDYVVFILQFVNVYHADWWILKKSLHPWDKSHLIFVVDPFNVLLDSVCWFFFLRTFASICKWYWPVIFFLCDIFIWSWYQHDGGLIEWVWKYFFLCNFLE